MKPLLAPCLKPPASLSAFLLLGLCRVGWAAPIRVQVLGPGQKPVPGAQVRVRFRDKAAPRDAEPLQAVADAEGSATFEAPATVQPYIGTLGFATAWSDGLSVGAIELRNEGNDITLAPVGVARGLVVDEKGQPVVGATVRLLAVGPPGEGAPAPVYTVFHSRIDASISQARTDDAGRWTLARVPLGGAVEVSLGDANFEEGLAVTRAVAPDAPPNWAPAEAAARTVATDPEPNPDVNPERKGVLVARPSGTITGRVTDPDGAPVAGVIVDIQGQVWRRGASRATTTDARGEFRFARAGVNTYQLTTRGPLERDIEWVSGEPLKVAVTPGAQVSVPNVRMIPGGLIEVRVLDEDTGAGIAGVQVYANPIAGGAPVATTRPSDEQGRSRLRVAPGKQRLRLSGLPQEYLAAGQALGESATVEVVAGQAQAQSVVLKLKKHTP